MSRCYLSFILLAFPLATLMLSAAAVHVPHSTKLHRRFTFVSKLPPGKWDTNSLEDYEQYHFRYLSLSCHKRKSDQDFFDSCCHPRSKNEKLSDIPSECQLSPASLVKAQFLILKSRDQNGNITAEKQGKPVFVPNGTLQALSICNGSELPTSAQIKQLTQLSALLSIASNSAHHNGTGGLNSTHSLATFANITQFNNSSLALLLNSNITQLLNPNLTQLLRSNFTQLLNSNLTHLFHSNLTVFANFTHLLTANATQYPNITDYCQSAFPIASVKDIQTEPVTLAVSQPVSAAIAPEQTSVNSEVAESKANNDAQVAADAKAASEAEAAAKIRAAGDAKAAGDAQAVRDQAAEASKKAPEEKAAADAKAAQDQAAADAKATADAKKAAEDKAAADAQAAADAKAAADTKAAVDAQATHDSKSGNADSAIGSLLTGISQVFGTDGDAKATFFYQEGGTGACGNVNPDSTPLVALPPDLYANGAHCGKDVKIVNTANGKSVVAKVQDMCPGCPSPTSLDLSTGAYDAIGLQDTGVLPIHWGFM